MNGNPSIHTVIPCANGFAVRSKQCTKRSFPVPGGKRFFKVAIKLLCAGGIVLGASTLWLGHSINRVDEQISKIELQKEQLLNANILMRAKKAALFSKETVADMAGDQLAIHNPDKQLQYKHLRE